MTRDQRTIAETTYVAEDGREANTRIDVGVFEDENHNEVPVGSEEADHQNIVHSVDIAESGSRTVIDNAHSDL